MSKESSCSNKNSNANSKVEKESSYDNNDLYQNRTCQT